MKNVLTTALIITPALILSAMATAVWAQPVTPGTPSGGNMQQLPVQTGEGQSIQTDNQNGQRVMPDGTTVSDPTLPATAAGSVRVRMPDGKLVDIPSSGDTPWYRSEQMQGYTSYYFDPANRVYVVRGDKNPDNWPKKNWGVE
jgi:hypothetical protein